MILTSLCQYYDCLVGSLDPETGELKVPTFGYSYEKIGCVLVISEDGTLVNTINHFSPGKNPRPKKMSVPRPEKRTSGIEPNFLWDKPAYVLGVCPNQDKKAAELIPWLATPGTFAAFRQVHIKEIGENKDTGLVALVKFLQRWEPDDIDKQPCNHNILQTNLVFKLEGDAGYLHERNAAKKLWARLLAETASVSGTCLVTGERGKIARLHPAIKGVRGGQSSGGSIVAYNAKSYESYGKTQGENAPVSELAAFKYTTALNYLLNRDNKHCLSIGDTSTVFWAVETEYAQATAAERRFMQTVNPGNNDAASLKPLVKQIAQGRPSQEIVPDIDPDMRFYILGLAPNASRISIRYWLDTTFGALEARLADHYRDLALDPLPWKKPPSVWRLLIELAPHRTGEAANTADIPAHLAGDVMRSILTGDRYPQSLLTRVIQRIRADSHISPLRVALIKCVIHRDYRKHLLTEDIPMGLNVESNNDAYQLGRLFAVLERTQTCAIKDIGTSITNRFFSAASTAPYTVFARLLTGHKHHLGKLRKKMPGYAIVLDKDIMGIIGRLPPDFPVHLSIADQGRFVIGYYHQREKYFEPRPEVDEVDEVDIEPATL